MPLRVCAVVCLILAALCVGGIKGRLANGLPEDVLRNSDIARERMKRLWLGNLLYINEHEHPPADPAELYPHYVPDPLIFWHPGDTDPPPTTIDNSVPNAANSARISFEWGNLSDRGAWDRFVLWDNSPGNNGGQFVNMLTAGNLIETDPPLATPTPTAVAIAQARLRAIAGEMKYYSYDYSERLPNSLMRLWESGSFSRTESFWNPGDWFPPPETFTNSEPDKPDSIQGSFLYYGMGFRRWELTPNQILMRDENSVNNRRIGFNVLWGDWRVTFEPEGGLRGDANRDGIVNPADWAAMNGCLDGPDAPIIDIDCRIFDWDSDDRLDLADVARFLQDNRD